MRVSFYLLIFSLYAFPSLSNNKAFYEGRAKFIKEYINELQVLRKKDPDYNGAIAESLTGSFFQALDKKSQDQVEAQALESCKKNNNKGCKIRFRGLAINPDYNRLAVFDKSKGNLNVGMEDIPSNFMLSHKGISFVFSTSDYQAKDFTCAKTNKDNDFIVDIIVSQIDLYPTSFLGKAGLKFVLICGDIKALGSSPEGLAPSHYDQSPGVFMLSVQKIKKQIDAGQPQIIKHIFHHEYYHVIDSTLTKAVVDDDWVNINRNPYSPENLKANVNEILSDGRGFVSNYAKNNEFEDKAELFAYLVTKNKEMRSVMTKDVVIFRKTKLMIERMKSLSGDINGNFWSKLLK
ncbi:putative zinc-binding metallopeptidase [Candidatus Pelagibacter sp. HIMB1517]|uniref:putative zinc-binding metallopeptidase n=1 Tax=Candidatus Pelagibacter sp. HIMB1517 TaxID=3413341 RepID=UPI003F85C297